MKILKHEGFIDIWSDKTGYNEIETENWLRTHLIGKGYKITDAPMGRVGDMGNGIIFRFITED